MDRKEQNRIRMREWRKTPKGKKTNKIDDWRRLGLVDDYEKIYDIYLNTHECMKCNIEISGKNKCMDHCHITNLYRAVLCQSCNIGNPLDVRCNKTNKLGIKYITTQDTGYRFRKTIKGKEHAKWFKTLEEAIQYKDVFLSNL